MITILLIKKLCLPQHDLTSIKYAHTSLMIVFIESLSQGDRTESVLSQLYVDAQRYASRHLMAIVRSSKFQALDKAAQEKFMARVEMFNSDASSLQLSNHDRNRAGSSFVVLNVRIIHIPVPNAKSTS